jgi:tetratricopeptide (TPR) repeat protein
VYNQSGRTGAGMPTEFKGLLTANQLAALDAINTLQTNPNDSESLLKMANVYFDANETAALTDAGAAIGYGQQGIRYYERYLKLSPQDNDARADLATLYFATGQTDRAIQEVALVLQRDTNHVKANFNLGLFYGQGRGDYPAAEAQFKKVIALTQNDSNQHAVFQQATLLLEQVKKLSNPSTEASGVKQ